MLQMLTESPFFLVAIAGFITVILLVMYFQMRDSRLVPFIVAGVALTLAPFLIDAMVVTDNEAIKRTVQRIARSVQQNDVPATLRFAHPDSPGVSEAIQNEMPIYDFTWCTVSGFKNIEVNDAGTDAVVTFRVWVNVKAKRGPEGVGDREIVLEMRKDLVDEAWKIMNYRHYDPRRRDRQGL